MSFLLFLFLHEFSFAKVENIDFLQKNCLQELAKKADKEKTCSCYGKNLAARLDSDFLTVLVKSKKKLSIHKELQEMEGIKTVFHFESNVRKECSQNPNWDVGPEDKGEADELPPKKM